MATMNEQLARRAMLLLRQDRGITIRYADAAEGAGLLDTDDLRGLVVRRRGSESVLKHRISGVVRRWFFG